MLNCIINKTGKTNIYKINPKSKHHLEYPYISSTQTPKISHVVYSKKNSNSTKEIYDKIMSKGITINIKTSKSRQRNTKTKMQRLPSSNTSNINIKDSGYILTSNNSNLIKDLVMMKYSNNSSKNTFTYNNSCIINTSCNNNTLYNNTKSNYKNSNTLSNNTQANNVKSLNTFNNNTYYNSITNNTYNLTNTNSINNTYDNITNNTSINDKKSKKKILLQNFSNNRINLIDINIYLIIRYKDQKLGIIIKKTDNGLTLTKRINDYFSLNLDAFLLKKLAIEIAKQINNIFRCIAERPSITNYGAVIEIEKIIRDYQNNVNCSQLMTETNNRIYSLKNSICPTSINSPKITLNDNINLINNQKIQIKIKFGNEQYIYFLTNIDEDLNDIVDNIVENINKDGKYKMSLKKEIETTIKKSINKTIIKHQQQQLLTAET